MVKESSGDRTSFSYDKTYQLTRERKSGAVTYDVTYSYDPVGNRLVQNDSGTRTTMAYDVANQVLTEETGANRTTYTHDNCGNRTRKDAPAALTVYRWDEDNKPTSIHPPSNPVTLTYNALGRRIKKVNPTTTRKFIYDFEKVLQETDNADATTEAYTSTTEQYGELVSAYDGSQTSYFQDDALGSTDALLDDAETVTDRYRYRAFGLDSHYQGSTTNPYTFVGQQGYYRDNEIDLYFVGARYYDYALGRWISQDPLGFDAGDSNLYQYAQNGPSNALDPSGLREGNFTDASSNFRAKVIAVGASKRGFPLEVDSSSYGIFVKVTTATDPYGELRVGSFTDFANVKIFQIVRGELFISAGRGKEGYLTIRLPALSNQKPSLLYVNPPDSPVWGLDAPSDSPGYLPVTRRDCSLFFNDIPTPNADDLKVLDPVFKKYGVQYAEKRTTWKAFIEYKGRLEVEVVWNNIAVYNRGEIGDLHYHVLSLDWAKEKTSIFQKLLTKKDANKPSTGKEILDQIKAITGD